MNKKERIASFVQTIWSWYAVHKRALPWRDVQIADDTERAYRILVSEVMLQQTQVSRVIHIYRSFLETFPKIENLANASNRDVLIAWRGMGYNSRALRLRDAAKVVSEETQDIRHKTQVQFPKNMEELQAIPGIGHYTAAAIRNFAFNIPTPCIDTNIRRILHRTFVGSENPDGTWEKNDAYILKIAEEVLEVAIRNKKQEVRSKRTAADWHAALMDFGSLVQTKSNPKWDICPLTAKGMMKTTPKNFIRQSLETPPRGVSTKREPGRFVGTMYIPNRIFRGKIVEALRDAPKGLEPEALGKAVCIDWSKRQHERWLRGMLEKLLQDGLIEQTRSAFFLKS